MYINQDDGTAVRLYDNKYRDGLLQPTFAKFNIQLKWEDRLLKKRDTDTEWNNINLHNILSPNNLLLKMGYLESQARSFYHDLLETTVHVLYTCQ